MTKDGQVLINLETESTQRDGISFHTTKPNTKGHLRRDSYLNVKHDYPGQI